MSWFASRRSLGFDVLNSSLSVTMMQQIYEELDDMRFKEYYVVRSV